MASEKLDTVLKWLPEGLVRVHLDATRDGVRVPRDYAKKDSVILEWGFNLPRQIADLKVDQEAISGTLSFDAGFFYCFVPWHAVFAITSPVLDKAGVWLNDASLRVQRKMLEKAGEAANAKLRRKSFGLIQGGKAGSK
jgi:stringent starvation protein B